jgi:hypothetical protein
LCVFDVFYSLCTERFELLPVVDCWWYGTDLNFKMHYRCNYVYRLQERVSIEMVVENSRKSKSNRWVVHPKWESSCGQAGSA